jgi:hypothetical protein
LTASLPAQFVYPAADEARRALEATSGSAGYSKRLQRFEVTRMLVTPDALVLTLDFELIIGGMLPTGDTLPTHDTLPT